MDDISNLRDGSFYYIEKLEMVEESFIDALGGLFSVVAELFLQEVKSIKNSKEIKICFFIGLVFFKNKEFILYLVGYFKK